ncbi:MAG: hypothetical protein FJZ11_06900, partial [Candidatus Omnitrophica bacterium]|nr:hypothetical protein [Candidatus Omnitrophota bacterium]
MDKTIADLNRIVDETWRDWRTLPDDKVLEAEYNQAVSDFNSRVPEILARQKQLRQQLSGFSREITILIDEHNGNNQTGSLGNTSLQCFGAGLAALIAANLSGLLHLQVPNPSVAPTLEFLEVGIPTALDVGTGGESLVLGGSFAAALGFLPFASGIVKSRKLLDKEWKEEYDSNIRQWLIDTLNLLHKGPFKIASEKGQVEIKLSMPRGKRIILRGLQPGVKVSRVSNTLLLVKGDRKLLLFFSCCDDKVVVFRIRRNFQDVYEPLYGFKLLPVKINLKTQETESVDLSLSPGIPALRAFCRQRQEANPSSNHFALGAGLAMMAARAGVAATEKAPIISGGLFGYTVTLVPIAVLAIILLIYRDEAKPILIGLVNDILGTKLGRKRPGQPETYKDKIRKLTKEVEPYQYWRVYVKLIRLAERWRIRKLLEARDEDKLRMLCENIRKYFAVDEETFDLENAWYGKKTDSFGFSKLLYIFGTIAGLEVKIVRAAELDFVNMVRINGKWVFVDLSRNGQHGCDLEYYQTQPFDFNENYELNSTGSYYKLKQTSQLERPTFSFIQIWESKDAEATQNALIARN